jgi:hypothetical protein
MRLSGVMWPTARGATGAGTATECSVGWCSGYLGLQSRVALATADPAAVAPRLLSRLACRRSSSAVPELDYATAASSAAALAARWVVSRLGSGLAGLGWLEPIGRLGWSQGMRQEFGSSAAALEQHLRQGGSICGSCMAGLSDSRQRRQARRGAWKQA